MVFSLMYSQISYKSLGISIYIYIYNFDKKLRLFRFKSAKSLQCPIHNKVEQ